jgi:hypothetical protein
MSLSRQKQLESFVPGQIPDRFFQLRQEGSYQMQILKDNPFSSGISSHQHLKGHLILSTTHRHLQYFLITPPRLLLDLFGRVKPRGSDEQYWLGAGS